MAPLAARWIASSLALLAMTELISEKNNTRLPVVNASVIIEL
jgi:hypothetical protein